MTLYTHQTEGIAFLASRHAAMLADEMGLGKTRQALCAAQRLFRERKIDRVLVLAPAAVRYSWREEMNKLEAIDCRFLPCIYKASDQTIYGAQARERDMLPVCVLSYALLPQKRHLEALVEWCEDGKTLLVCDESSFLKNRTAKQTKGAAQIAKSCCYRWLLTGTPVANSPLDLFGQAMVMSNGGRGPLSSFASWWQFQARYAVLKQMQMGPNIKFKQVVGYQNIDELNKRFKPYVLRREKKDCLDLPQKSYTVREVALDEATWQVYTELRKEALLALPDADVKPEPNAAVRLLRLCQLTSGHVGSAIRECPALEDVENYNVQDVSREKLDWLVFELLDGELSTQQAIICWCRWRRERERLQQMLATKIELYRVFGGQQEKNRSAEISGFQGSANRRVLVAQPHAGGYGLNLAAASTAVFLSNDFSYTTRVQAEDRCHRIGQVNPVTYIDVLAVGPKGQRTVDHHVLECLRAKKSLAEQTCSTWRKALEEF